MVKIDAGSEEMLLDAVFAANVKGPPGASAAQQFLANFRID